MTTEQLYDAIQQATGQRPTDHRPLHGGMIGDVVRVTLPDGSWLVAKIAQSVADGLATEGAMLRYLRDHSPLPVPDVLHSDDHLLLMSYIDGESRFGTVEQRHAAELVAALHNVTWTAHGHPTDTIIATLPQPNPPTDSRIDFFRDHRLLHMARLANEHGTLPSATRQRVEALAARLGDYLLEPDAPSLLHGDLWTTNILARDGRITEFLDPAIYYGHAEVELAFSTLFGTFGEPFFERYNDIRPLEPGFFETRRDIYNLYPLLVHVRLFGAGYVASVERILSRFGA